MLPRLCEYSGRGGGTTLVVEATICVVLLGLVVGRFSCRLEVVFVQRVASVTRFSLLSLVCVCSSRVKNEDT